jgi:hypothetical protein
MSFAVSLINHGFRSRLCCKSLYCAKMQTIVIVMQLQRFLELLYCGYNYGLPLNYQLNNFTTISFIILSLF